MKKFFTIFIILVFLFGAPVLAFGKKAKNVLILSSSDPSLALDDGKVVNEDFFKINQRIYFLIYVPRGFSSDYIKYQIVKQDDNAHVQGFTRIRNITRRVKNKNYYSDSFTLSQAGKYFIQIFDITNVHHWLAIGGFRVVEE